MGDDIEDAGDFEGGAWRVAWDAEARQRGARCAAQIVRARHSKPPRDAEALARRIERRCARRNAARYAELCRANTVCAADAL